MDFEKRRKYSPRFLGEIVVEAESAFFDSFVVERATFDDLEKAKSELHIKLQRLINDRPASVFHVRIYRLTRINK